MQKIEKDWIKELRTNSDNAFRILYDRYEGECVGWLRKNYGTSDTDGKEVFQASLIILYNNVISGKLQSLTSNIKTYLFSIAKNKAKETGRKYQKEIRTDDPYPFIKDIVINEGEGEAYREKVELALKGLKKLGDPCKSILEAYYYAEQNMSEIAESLEYKNADTVKNMKYKCLKRLRSIVLDIKGIK